MTHTAFCDVMLPHQRPWGTWLSRCLTDLYQVQGHPRSKYGAIRRTVFGYLDIGYHYRGLQR